MFSAMGALGFRAGTWWLSSRQDPRWQAFGFAETLSVLSLPQEAKVVLDAMKKKYGSPPEDLEYGCLKDTVAKGEGGLSNCLN